MSKVFKYIHPMLPISTGTLAWFAYSLRNEGGPCLSPLVVMVPVSFMGVLISIGLSLRRTLQCRRQCNLTDVKSK